MTKISEMAEQLKSGPQKRDESPGLDPQPRAMRAPVAPVDESRVQERMAEYLKSYDATTPNDRLMLLTLCRFEVALDSMNQKYLMMTTGSGKPSEIKAMTDAIGKLSAEARNIQVMLGIDKPSRGTEEDSGKKLMDYAHQAKLQLHRQGFPIICESCARSEDKRIFQFGFTVWHFAENPQVGEWSFSFVCPVCNLPSHIDHTNYKFIKQLAGWNDADSEKDSD